MAAGNQEVVSVKWLLSVGTARYEIWEWLQHKTERGQTVIISREQRPKRWIGEAQKQLVAISYLTKGWDGNDAVVPSVLVLEDALHLLRYLLSCSPTVVRKPHINPIRDGGVQLEWEAGSQYFEIEISVPGKARYFYRNKAQKVEHEGELVATYELFANCLM